MLGYDVGLAVLFIYDLVSFMLNAGEARDEKGDVGDDMSIYSSLS